MREEKNKTLMSRLLAALAGMLLITAVSCVDDTADYQAGDEPVIADSDAETNDIQFAAVTNTSDVMIQGFNWTSATGTWYDTVKAKAADLQASGINIIWFPPPSDAASKEGYLPRELYKVSSNYGTQAALQAAITEMHNKGIKVLADIVINHRVGTTNWADFTNPAWGSSSVCKGDEWTGATGNYDSGDGYSAARDLDHSNATVQTDIKAWLNWLKNTIGFDGWRYDYVKGYAGSYNKIYNDATSPYFSVGELWPDITGDYYASGSNCDYHRQKLMNWIDATGATSTVFDFTTKWQLQLACERDEYWRMGTVPGAIGWYPARSVTFIDNHDTGSTQAHWPFPSAKVMEGYAYILTHPGIPCVFWDHFYNWGHHDAIKALIQIRKNNGINATSAVSVKESTATVYAAVIGGKVAMKIGPGSWSPGSGWTLSASGTNYAVWTTSTGGTSPLEPQNLTATTKSTSTIDLAWNSSEGATSYTVYRATASAGTYTSLGSVSTPYYTASGLTANTTYYFKVTASNSYGTSGYSNIASAKTNADPSGSTTTINIVYDVGMGNSMYVRGSASPLSWTTGTAMTWTTGNVWTYSTTAIAAGTAFEFKALINNATWSDGANFAGVGGQTITVYPTFNGNFYDVMDTFKNWTVSGYTGAGKWHISSYTARAYGCTTESVLTQNFYMSKTGTVTLAFKYKLTGLDSGEYLAVDVLKGSTWYQVKSLTGTQDWKNIAIDISAYGSTSMKLRFRTKMNLTSEYVYVDNVSVAVK